MEPRECTDHSRVFREGFVVEIEGGLGDRKRDSKTEEEE